MNTNLFRKSSIDRVNSPDQLNEYIRVANPGVWLVLAAIIILLAGVIIWGIFGVVETKIETGIVVENGNAVCYVLADDASRLEEGMAVTAGDFSGKIKSVAKSPIQINEDFDDYILYLTGFSAGDFCYAAEIDISGIEDGIYSAFITLDSVHPISFVIH